MDREEVSPRRALSDDTYEALKELLVNQQLPGPRLNIDRLAQRLSVSATPVREALARLESEGLVLKEPMRGYFVTPMLDSIALMSLYEVRLLVEPHGARRAARNRRADELEEMTDAVKAMRGATTGRSYREFRSFLINDAKFHDAIARASRNQFLTDTVERLHSHQQLSRIWAVSGVPNANDALPQHESILEAIADRDPDAAEQLMREHIRRSRMNTMALIDPEVIAIDGPEPVDLFQKDSKK